MADANPRIAVACQGGGSHTAFSAGVLQRLLEADGYDFVAFSGTSGGAIDALLAWSGLLEDGPACAAKRLEAFWQDMAATSAEERFLNDWAVWAHRAVGILVDPEITPYAYPEWAASRLRAAVNAQVDFDRLGDLVARRGPASPMLLLGAVEVLSGAFTVFRSGWDAASGEPILEATAEAVLASAAVPSLFRAVHSAGGVYWDGLFSQNPPVRDLPDAQPDEIWVVQINPSRRATEPITTAEIRDRRNELSGNLSLNQELFFIRKINELVAGDGHGNRLAPGGTYRHIEVRVIEMDYGSDLDTESKLDRSAPFLESLLERGRAQADAFLRELPTGPPVGAAGVSDRRPSPAGARGSRTPG